MSNTTQTALVTGANKGIGLETARQLAQRGLTVWLGCRDEARGVAAAKELAKDGDVRFVRLDVTDLASIRAAAARIEKESGALDLLVNNAGIAVKSDALPTTVPLEAITQTFDVNFHGVLRVTQTFLPLLEKAKAGRIVNVSSTMGSVGTVLLPDSPLRNFPAFAYASSKTALGALTAWFAVALEGTKVRINAVCPGYNATDLNDNQGTMHPSEGASFVVKVATLGDDAPNGAFLNASGTVPW